MSQLTLLITPTARQLLQGFYIFLMDNDAERQANEVMNLLLNEFEQLTQLPNLGKKYTPHSTIEILQDLEIREKNVSHGKGGYSFLYVVQDDALVILTVKNYRQKNYTFPFSFT